MNRPPLFAVTFAVLAAVAVPAAAAPSPAVGQRNVAAAYTGGGTDSPGAGIPAMYIRVGAQGGQTHSVTVPTLRQERTVTVRLADTTGRPVLAAVVQHPTGDARDDIELGRVCTGQSGRFRLASPGSDLTVYPLAGACPAGPSLPTTGTVDLAFSR
jgi:hypothetical protein